LCWNYTNENLIDIIRFLIEKGIDVNCKGIGGDNALHILCEYYQNENLIDIIRLLIENGSEVSTETFNYFTYCYKPFYRKQSRNEILNLLRLHLKR
jgi:ankyrin repeat protein